MSLYSLSKDELVKIISTVNYTELEKQIAELTKKHNYLITQLKIFDLGYLTCNVCELTDILDDIYVCKIMTCTKCDKSYHLECISIHSM